jgi:hypothetical protein
MQDELTGRLVADAGVGGAAAANSNASRSWFAARATDCDGARAVY